MAGGEYTVFAALGTVQVMEATGCDRSTAAMAIATAATPYEGVDLTSALLTDFLLSAINSVRAARALAQMRTD